ncbi:MAG: nicotinate-nucleotide adenylyltransferase [Gammaproteobacteria bacterium]|nr:nicotinate-nucleotide adenylyltransferase [Gammaproteobacteria bacterium]MBU1416031.1 nicotinate-nucleotide adenylyltransferase [Gammaproteobacteria bacterium]
MSSTANRPVADQPLGILGGTFDPIHTAHLRLAEEAMDRLHLGGVLWVPAGRPSHRAQPLADSGHRLEMVRLAIANEPRFAVDDAEVRAVEPSYTVPTLERLRQALGQDRPLVLLMGADAFLGLASWHRWRELFQLAHIGVASRPTFTLDAGAMSDELAEEFRRRHRSRFSALAAAPAGTIVTFPLVAGTVSSTEVREKLRQGAAAAELLPATVLDYIRRNSLYSN